MATTPKSPVTVSRSLAAGCLFALAAACSRAPAAPPAVPPVIPAPRYVSHSGGVLTLGRQTLIVVNKDAEARVREIAGILREGLSDAAGIDASVDTDKTLPREGTIRLRLVSGGQPLSPEAYRLEVGSAVEITASDPSGLLWGAQTLLQSIQASGSSASIPKGTVTDSPGRPWRGLMLDPVRSFLDLDFIRRTIRVMSAAKMNVLHLHLIDDQAWRFESKAFPKCNRPGEPFYTQPELRDLVAFAARYGVEIVPEFDVPGHSMTAVNAYPELDCERRPRKMNQAILCAGRPFTREFIDGLIAESASVFPSPYIHLGGDEPYAIRRWASCPDCRARMEREGVTGLEALYHVFINDLDRMAKRRGKTLIVWNDAVHPGIAPEPEKDIIIDAWTEFDTVAALAGAGYPLLNSSNGPLYLTSFGLREGLPLAAVEAWKPYLFPSPGPSRGDRTLSYRTLPPEARILGGHASAWATEQGLAERRLYPRLLAVAENLWREDLPTDEAEFQSRYRAGFAAFLERMGIPGDDAAPEERPFPGPDGALPAAQSPFPTWAVSPKTYRDFCLSFDLQAPAGSDHTGVFIRCAGVPATGSDPEGFPIVAAAPPGLVMSGDLRLAEGWDHFEVAVRGPIIALTINGGLAWSVVDPSPRAGPIVLKSTGPGWRIRQVRLQRLEGTE